MPRSLFRKEAIDAQREKFLGEAVIAQPVRLWVYSSAAAAIAMIVIALAVWGQYARRERVQGVLSSQVGAAQVRMPDAGTVAEVFVREGDAVVRGAPLAKLSIDRSGTNDEKANEAVLAELETRRRILSQELEQARALGEQQVDQAKKKVASLQVEVRQSDEEIKLQTQRLESATRLLDKWQELATKDFASEYYVIQYQNQAKDQEIKVQGLRRDRANLQSRLTDAITEVPNVTLRAAQQTDLINRQISGVTQEIAEQAAKREQSVKRDMLVAAPIDGTVTNIGPVRGQTVAADASFAVVLPKDSPLQAELLVPTRAIGFVHPGQSVRLRYEAFPYERFGQYTGEVESVGKTILVQGESVGTLAIREPAYRIVVHLDRQSIDAGAQELPLRAGMVVSADLLMEKRSILEWLFQPVLQLRERVSS